MASAIRQMTGVGGDVRKIARLLQKKAPPGHMLAYINQEEADLLKARGGSGEPHEDTGVPSFADTWDYSESLPTSATAPLDLTSTQAPAYQTIGEQLHLADQYAQYRSAPSVATPSAAPAAVDVPMTDASSGYYRPYYADPVAPSASYGDFAVAPAGSRYIDQTLSDRYLPSAVGAPAPSAVAATEDKDLLGKVGDWWGTLSPDTKARLGIGGVQAVLGAYQSQQAAEQGRKAKEEIQRLAQPYQQQGKELVAKAQRGELSPAAQQQLQAVQAQAAQGAQARGGVGAQQAQAQVEAFRQQLLQSQYDYGLKVSGIGDQIAMGAIKTGLEADRYVNQLTSNYFTNIARAAYGQAPQVPGQQPGSTTTIA